MSSPRPTMLASALIKNMRWSTTSGACSRGSAQTTKLDFRRRRVHLTRRTLLHHGYLDLLLALQENHGLVSQTTPEQAWALSWALFAQVAKGVRIRQKMLSLLPRSARATEQILLDAFRNPGAKSPGLSTGMRQTPQRCPVACHVHRMPADVDIGGFQHGVTRQDDFRDIVTARGLF